MLKQKLEKYKIVHIKSLTAIIVIAVVLAGATFYGGLVRADQFDAQIQALRDQNAANQQSANQLAAQASSYQDAVNKLQQQIDDLQQAIVSNQKASDELQVKIEAEQIELDHQKHVLGEDIKAMYLEGKISTLEILASSNDLSDYVNKQVSRSAVENKVTDTVNQINQLKQQLQEQQRELQSRIKDQQAQQAQINASESQQAQLLAYTQDQKANYDQQIKTNNSQIASLRMQQLAANHRLGGTAVAGDPGHGGYPAYLDNAYQDSLIDPWGMLNRECVSYTAWKVQQTYGYMPYWGGVGNANQWPSDAQSAGIPTGSVPRVHSVAISMGGAYGHAMWVEAVNGNMIYVSQYNYDLAGHYSEMYINGSGLIYIYFGG
ncbi:MAG TPA: CHAP domain-containing protein [Candidatus Saccharimonadales bacterium]|nr:CHAP domain-containing protein [Candidatus Saccharimonadales bacterium]